jgi:hypothetical protein
LPKSRLSVLLVQWLYSGRRLDPNAIVHCVPDSLLAAEIFLSRLNRNVSKQKLNLLQFAASDMAKTGTRAAEIMRRQLAQPELWGVVFDNVPDHSVSHEVAPSLASSTNTSKKVPATYTGRADPLLDRSRHPIRNRHSSEVPAFSCQVDYGPVIFSALNIVQFQCYNLATAQSASQKK